MSLVKFKVGKSKDFKASSADEETIYFVEDTKSIYKGNVEYANNHYSSKTVVSSSATSTTDTSSALNNSMVYVNHVENGEVTASHRITGTGAASVTTNTTGDLIISSENTTYPAASSSNNGLMTPAMVTKLASIDEGANAVNIVSPLRADGDAPAANANAGLAIGTSARADGAYSVAIGSGAIASASDTMALGVQASVSGSAEGSVALGFQSTASDSDEFSVGNSSTTRRITHVTDPEEDADATTKSYVDTGLAAKADISHTHPYAGSSSAGGAATTALSADKLSTSAGSATNPVYFSDGKPVKTTYTLAKSVPSTAVFTDTTYSAGTGISLSGTTFSNSGVRTVSTGTSNGTISVNTNGKTADVSVKGLGSAAYTDSTEYAATSHTHDYLPLTGGTLTGTVTSTSTKSGEKILFGASSTTSNRGLYDSSCSKWMIYADKNNNVYVDGDLNGTASYAKQISYGKAKCVNNSSSSVVYWRMFSFDTATAYKDCSMICAIEGAAGNGTGSSGVFAVFARTGKITDTSATSDASMKLYVRWLSRQGIEADQICGGVKTVLGGTCYADVYFKSRGPYNGVNVRVLSCSSSRGTNATSWVVTDDTTTSSAMDVREYDSTVNGVDGGTVLSAASLSVGDVGSETNPVYFKDGVPVKTAYTLGMATTTAYGFMSSADKKRLDGMSAATAVTSTSTAISLTASTATQVTLTTLTGADKSNLSISSGGVKCAVAGYVKVSGCARVDGAGTKYMYVSKGSAFSGASVISSTIESDATGCSKLVMPPRIFSVTAGQILFLSVKTSGTSNSLYPSSTYTYLTVEYMA